MYKDSGHSNEGGNKFFPMLVLLIFPDSEPSCPHNVGIQSVSEWVLRYVHSSGKKTNIRAEHRGNQLFNSDFYSYQVSQLYPSSASWCHSFHNPNWESALCQELLSFCCCWIKLRMLGKALNNTGAGAGMDSWPKLPSTPSLGQVVDCTMRGISGRALQRGWGWAQVRSAPSRTGIRHECFPINSSVCLSYQGKSLVFFLWGRGWTRKTTKHDHELFESGYICSVTVGQTCFDNKNRHQAAPMYQLFLFSPHYNPMKWVLLVTPFHR